MAPEQTLLRIKRIADDYGVRGILFSDDNFFLSPDRAYQILEGIVQQRLNIVWRKGDIRLDLLSQVDDDFLNLMEKSGCLHLVVGVESGSQRIADLIKKEIDVSQAVSINHRLAKYQMQLRFLFLIGIPGETEADLAKTSSLMLRLTDENQKAAVGVQIFVPFPETELFDLSIQYGFHVPQKLEGWISFGWANRRQNYPWLSPETQRLLQMLSFCSIFISGDRNLRDFGYNSPFMSLIANIYSPIARKRIHGLHYRFFPELKVAEVLGFRGF